MHLLALTVLSFLCALYGLSLKSYGLVAMLLGLISWGLAREGKRYVLVALLGLFLAWVSLDHYYGTGTPVNLRITARYERSTVVNEGSRKYLLEEAMPDFPEGTVLTGKVKVTAREPLRSGYAGVVEIWEMKAHSDGISKMQRVKQNLMDQVMEKYGFDRGSLMASLVLGRTEGIDERRSEDMENLGIMHILSISGFHFALLEMALKRLGLKKGRLPVMLFYAFFIGSVPGYRTVLTICYREVSYACRREGDPVTGLALAFFLQAFLQPYLIFRPGFLLTYFSTLGILLFHPPLLNYFLHGPILFLESMVMTLSALSLSLPMVLAFAPELSLGIFPGNLLMVPLYTIITYFSFIGVLVVDIPVLTTIIEPFMGIFFDLAAYVGRFMGSMKLVLNLEHLVFGYVGVALSLYLFLRKGARKRALVFLLVILLFTLPWGTSVSLYNKYGLPYIRITHKMKVYDIMDYRIAEEGMTSLRKAMVMTLDNRTIRIEPSGNPRGVPRVYLDNRRLNLGDRLEYTSGVYRVKKVMLMGRKVMRVK